MVIFLIRFNSQSQVLPIGCGYFLGAHIGHRCASWRGVKMSASVNTDDNRKKQQKESPSVVFFEIQRIFIRRHVPEQTLLHVL